jgi:hypothetical protein
MDPYADPDPAIFIIDLQDAKKKIEKFFCILLFEGTFTSFFIDIKSKRSHKTTKHCLPPTVSHVPNNHKDTKPLNVVFTGA